MYVYVNGGDRGTSVVGASMGGGEVSVVGSSLEGVEAFIKGQLEYRGGGYE
jgi:hypothetical protein